MNAEKKSFFDEVGGLRVISSVHKKFYDKVYAHPWIGKFFIQIKQDVIESQQTDFMAQLFGGPSDYKGKLPVATHKHMFITEELFLLRSQLLRDSLKEEGVLPEFIEKWMKIDSSFKNAIVKKNRDECQKRFFTDEIEDYENPLKKVG